MVAAVTPTEDQRLTLLWPRATSRHTAGVPRRSQPLRSEVVDCHEVSRSALVHEAIDSYRGTSFRGDY
jgi:hypothetical protein